MDAPRLALAALRALRGLINSALLSLSSSETIMERWKDYRPASCQQLDLLVHASRQLEHSRLPATIRRELILLLKVLMAECIAVSAAQPIEAVDQ